MSGKRKAIDGDSLISMVEKLNDVRKVEQITWERGAKKQKVSRKSSSKAKVESSDESEAGLNDSGEGEIEILDCIEVKFNSRIF